MYIPNLSVVCFFICLSYFIFYCALLLFCAQAWHGKTLSSRNDPIFFCSLHWRNLSLYNKITTTNFKQIRFWWKNVIIFRGKVYSNFFECSLPLPDLSCLSHSCTPGFLRMLTWGQWLSPWRLILQAIVLAVRPKLWNRPILNKSCNNCCSCITYTVIYSAKPNLYFDRLPWGPFKFL